MLAQEVVAVVADVEVQMQEAEVAGAVEEEEQYLPQSK